MNQEQQPKEAQEPTEETITKSLQGLPSRRSPEFRVIYSNSVRFAAAPWDFSLVFGQAIVDQVNDLHVEDRVTVTLSPQTAKAVAEILVRNLQEYEAQFGEIWYTPRPQGQEEPSQ